MAAGLENLSIPGGVAEPITETSKKFTEHPNMKGKEKKFMKAFVALSLSVLISFMGSLTVHAAEIQQSRQELVKLEFPGGPPPGSLDNLYPPAAEAPVYQIKMFSMEEPFTGIAIETGRGDLERAKGYFEQFRTRYLELSKMVPEWENAYPSEPLDELQAFLETGERDKIMMAFGKVAQVCADCHTVNMPGVQQRYHWPDSSEFVVSDPVTKESLKYNQFMTYLNVSFVGMGLDLAQGQADSALKNFEAFDARYQTLKETCGGCHETERKYYVDSDIQALIDKLGVALKDESPDPSTVQALRQQIGTESCLKCHWVHIPATYSKFVWNAQKNAKKE